MNKALIAMDKSHSFRVYLAITTKMVEDARRIHQASPLGTAALGRVLTGAGLMGLQLKNNDDCFTHMAYISGEEPPAEPAAPTEAELLTEIRDLLKSKWNDPTEISPIF